MYKNGEVRYWNILTNGVRGFYRSCSGSKLYYFNYNLGSTCVVANSTGTVIEAHDYAKGIPSGLPIWLINARAHLPERQRDEGEVYGERTG